MKHEVDNILLRQVQSLLKSIVSNVNNGSSIACQMQATAATEILKEVNKLLQPPIVIISLVEARGVAIHICKEGEVLEEVARKRVDTLVRKRVDEGYTLIGGLTAKNGDELTYLVKPE